MSSSAPTTRRRRETAAAATAALTEPCRSTSNPLAINANGISEAEVTALDLRLAELEIRPAPEVEEVKRHGTGDAYRAKLYDEDAGIEPDVGSPRRAPC